jgi:hypothetical protein
MHSASFGRPNSVVTQAWPQESGTSRFRAKASTFAWNIWSKWLAAGPGLRIARTSSPSVAASWRATRPHRKRLPQTAGKYSRCYD